MFKSKNQQIIDRLGREINEIKTDFRVYKSQSNMEIEGLKQDLKLYELESEATLRNHKEAIEENRDKISSLKTVVWLLISSIIVLTIYASVKDSNLFKTIKED